MRKETLNSDAKYIAEFKRIENRLLQFGDSIDYTTLCEFTDKTERLINSKVSGADFG